MKTYSSLAGIAVFTLLANQSMAGDAKFGVGSSIDNNVKLYFPINTGNFLIEPTIAYSNDKHEDADLSRNYSKWEDIGFGVGVFKTGSALESTNIYYGARVGYINIKNTYSYTFGASYNESSSKEDGYYFSPTIGAEYYFVKNFSIGLDLSLNYTKIKRVYDGSSEASNITRTTFRTDTEVVLRYYF